MNGGTPPPRPSRLVPAPAGLNAEFYAHLAGGALHLQRCDGCGAFRHPPRYACAACGSDAWHWERASGRGRVFSWTVTHRPVDPAFEPPYAVVVVETEEGPRLVGTLAGLDPAHLALDLPVVVEIEPHDDKVAFLAFRPAP